MILIIGTPTLMTNIHIEGMIKLLNKKASHFLFMEFIYNFICLALIRSIKVWSIDPFVTSYQLKLYHICVGFNEIWQCQDNLYNAPTTTSPPLTSKIIGILQSSLSSVHILFQKITTFLSHKIWSSSFSILNKVSNLLFRS